MALCSDLDLTDFSEPGIFNYSTLLLSEESDSLYVGAREAIFELNKKNVTVRNNKVSNKICQWKKKYFIYFLNMIHICVFVFFYYFKVQWTVEEQAMKMCMLKGKSKEVSGANCIAMLFYWVL